MNGSRFRLRGQDQEGMNGDLDPYSVLGVERSCDQEAIKKRYQALAKELHPDRNVQCSDDEKKRRAELFQKVDRAYRLLADSAVREGVDAQIASEEVHHEWPVSDIVQLSEMDCSEHNGSLMYSLTCRCGGSYDISNADIASGVNIVCCSTCSLCIEVNTQHS